VLLCHVYIKQDAGEILVDALNYGMLLRAVLSVGLLAVFRRLSRCLAGFGRF
jgi:hypothetical protein